MYKRILVVVERPETAKVAVKEGVALAAFHGADLLFVHTFPRYVLPVAEAGPAVLSALEDFERETRSKAEQLLSSATAAARKAGVTSHVLTLSAADSAAAIVQTARQRRCNLIIAASEGRNAVMRMLAGSVIPRLITLATMPVMVCREATALRKRETPAPRKRARRPAPGAAVAPVDEA